MTPYLSIIHPIEKLPVASSRQIDPFLTEVALPDRRQVNLMTMLVSNQLSLGAAQVVVLNSESEEHAIPFMESIRQFPNADRVNIMHDFDPRLHQGDTNGRMNFANLLLIKDHPELNGAPCLHVKSTHIIIPSPGKGIKPLREYKSIGDPFSAQLELVAPDRLVGERMMTTLGQFGIVGLPPTPQQIFRHILEDPCMRIVSKPDITLLENIIFEGTRRHPEGTLRRVNL